MSPMYVPQNDPTQSKVFPQDAKIFAIVVSKSSERIVIRAVRAYVDNDTLAVDFDGTQCV